MKLIDFENFTPLDFIIIGTGLWGNVFDLGDGTVIKLIKKNCAGIGSGEIKITREYEVLSELAKLKLEGNFSIPQIFGYGKIPVRTIVDKLGFNFWLRMSKIAGQPRKISDLIKLSTQDLSSLGATLGEELASLHRALNSLALKTIFPSFSLEELKANSKDDIVLFKTTEELESRALDFLKNRSSYLIHGDFNISNILFKAGKCTGIIDFAETTLGFPEKDLSDLIKEIPQIQSSLIDSYQKYSGVMISQVGLELGLAINSLISVMIEKRQILYLKNHINLN